MDQKAFLRVSSGMSACIFCIFLSGCPEDNPLTGSGKKNAEQISQPDLPKGVPGKPEELIRIADPEQLAEVKDLVSEVIPAGGKVSSKIISEGVSREIALMTESVSVLSGTKASPEDDGRETAENAQLTGIGGTVQSASGSAEEQPVKVADSLHLVTNQEQIHQLIRDVTDPVIAPEDIIIETTENSVSYFGLKEGIEGYDLFQKEFQSPLIKTILTSGVLTSDPCKNSRAIFFDLATILDLKLAVNQVYSLTVCTDGKTGEETGKALVTKVFITGASQPEITDIKIVPEVSGSPTEESQRRKILITISGNNPRHTQYVLSLRPPEQEAGVYDHSLGIINFDEFVEDASDGLWLSPAENRGALPFYQTGDSTQVMEVSLPQGTAWYFSVMARNAAGITTGLSRELYFSVPSYSEINTLTGVSEVSDKTEDKVDAKEVDEHSEKPGMKTRDLESLLEEAREKLVTARKNLKNASLERLAIRKQKKEKMATSLQLNQAKSKVKDARNSVRVARKELQGLKKEIRKHYRDIYSDLKARKLLKASGKAG